MDVEHPETISSFTPYYPATGTPEDKLENSDSNRQIREIAEMYMKYEEELRETPVF